jgi:hypothetical protein
LALANVTEHGIKRTVAVLPLLLCGLEANAVLLGTPSPQGRQPGSSGVETYESWFLPMSPWA